MGKRQRQQRREAERRQRPAEPVVTRAIDEPAGGPLDALAEVVELQAQLERQRVRAIRAAREQGESWEEIAYVLGVTRQAASKRYGGQV